MAKKKQSQGTVANFTGRHAEAVVRGCIEATVGLEGTWSSWKRRSLLQTPPDYGIAFRNFKYRGLYGTECEIEFLMVLENTRIRDRRLHPYNESVTWIPVECKHQDKSGSCQEKLPYIVAMFEAHTCWKNLLFVHSGKWWTESKSGVGGIRWMKQQAKRLLPDKTLLIYSDETVGRWFRELTSGERTR